MTGFTVSYDITTEESAEYGDTAENGILGRDLTLRDAIELVTATRTNRVGGVSSIECDESPMRAPRWVTINNGIEYESGAYESRSLHFPPRLTAASRRRIARLLGVR